jgi:PAS domain S-box-containing protein
MRVAGRHAARPEAEGARTLRLLRLLARTAVASNEAQSVEAALGRALEDVCDVLGCEVGHAWLAAPDGSGDLVPSGIWRVADADSARFEPLCRAAAEDAAGARRAPGLLDRRRPLCATLAQDAAGRLRLRLADGEAVDLDSVAWPGLRVAWECGLRSFALIPIQARDEVVGALEIAASSVEPTDPELLETLGHVGTQLGRVIERERAARELRRREEHLRAILGALVDTPVVIVDRAGRIVETFGSIRSRYGVSEQQVLGDRPSEWLREDELRPIREAVARVYATGEPRRLEQSLDLPRGRCWFDFRLYPLRDEQGSVEQVLCLTYDLSERKRLEEALHETERLATRIAEFSPVGIFRIDPEGHAIYVNERLLEISGATRDEAGSDAWISRLAAPDDPGRAEALAAMAQGRPFAVVLRFVRADGTLTWALSQGVPDRDATGRLLGYVGTLTDITDRKRAEEELARHRDRLGDLVAERTAELERTHQRLRESERLAAVGTFAAGIAHQINNPVGAILIAAQFAQERLEDRDVVGMALEHIVTDARRCRGIVRSVLEFARGDIGDRKRCDLNEIVRKACENLLRDARERDVAIELDLAPGLPEIVASEAALDQVVVSLVENALEASARCIRLRSAPDPAGIALEIHDDGRGIAPEHVDHVIDPFFTTRRGSGGTGLGLSLAYGIVRGHGGRLEFASRPGRGTTVTVRLPAADEGVA